MLKEMNKHSLLLHIVILTSLYFFSTIYQIEASKFLKQIRF